MKFVHENGDGEIVEKKSRFLSSIVKVTSEEEAQEVVARRKKQYWDARHTCWAYVIGDRGQLQRFSDDGEPQGTAGKPILDVLAGKKITNAMILVTRYFGGILLGTGGLVRAYSKAASEAVEHATILEEISGVWISMKMEYTDLGKVQYYLETEGIATLDAAYTECVTLDVIVEEERAGQMESALTEKTGGRIEYLSREKTVFAMDGRNVILL